MRRKILKTTSVFLLAVALFMIQAPVTAWGGFLH